MQHTLNLSTEEILKLLKLKGHICHMEVVNDDQGLNPEGLTIQVEQTVGKDS